MSAEKIFPWVTMEDVALSNQKFEAAGKSYLLDKYLNTVAYCTAALRLNPNNAKNIKLLMGLAHLELGTSSSKWDFNDSIAACDLFDEVIEIDPTYSEAYLFCGIGIIHWGNNYEAAISYFDKTLELAPENDLARQYREVGRKCLEKKWDEAKRLFDKYLRLRGKENRKNFVREIIE